MSGAMLLHRVSRRKFLISTAAFATADSSMAIGLEGVLGAMIGSTIAYVGTYTGAVGGGSNGDGIYLFERNGLTGELSQPKLVAKTPNPSWIAIHPSKKYLYAVNEINNYHGNSGSVSAFAIDRESGDLKPLNVVSSEGAEPCYVSIDASGTYAFVANYGGGSIAVLPVLEGGFLGAANDAHRDNAQLGSTQAFNAPNGSFAVSGHDAPHAHMIAVDPQGSFVLATDLGQDRVYSYRLDRRTGKLIPADGASFVALPSGDGPRHFAFHPNGRWLYSIQEEASNIVFFRYDSGTGSLKPEQTISTVPSGFAGTSFASEVLVSPNGRFLYAANRLHDTIAVFAIDGDGRLKWVGETSTMGDYPGQCTIDPSGNFLYACNRKGDNITCFTIHRETGLLTFTGQYTGVGSPASITFFE